MMEFYDDAVLVARWAIVEERVQMLGGGVIPIEVLYWVMQEAESADPMQRKHWVSYRSRVQAQPDPEMEAVAVVLALPAPGSRFMPIVLEDEMPAVRVRRAVVTQMPHCSPLFPRRSPMLEH